MLASSAGSAEACFAWDGHMIRGDKASVEAVVSALRALRDAPVGWRPIESAPRDGERVLLGRSDHDGDGDGGVSVCGYWLDAVEDGVDYMGADAGFTDVDYQVFWPGRSFGMEPYRSAGKQPTHWQPLPEPPVVVVGEEG